MSVLRTPRGFTVVELIAVIVLLSVLGVVAMGRMTGPNMFAPTLLHAADNCTAYTASNATLADYSGNLQAGETAVLGPAGAANLLQGADDPDNTLELAAPGFGNEGSVVVTLDVAPWLEFDWQATGLADPAATASFGRFRGHDRIIYWGEPR